MSETASPWPLRLRLHEVQRTSQTLDLEADAPRRATIAKALDLAALNRFSAQVRLSRWLDGAQLDGRWEAEVTQVCGLTLELFDTTLRGEFQVRVVLIDSPAAGAPASEVSIDPEAADPPDVLEGDEMDVGGYLVEHLALEIDPFPRRPGAAFDPQPAESPASPFAVLQSLKPPQGATD